MILKILYVIFAVLVVIVCMVRLFWFFIKDDDKPFNYVELDKYLNEKCPIDKVIIKKEYSRKKKIYIEKSTRKL